MEAQMDVLTLPEQMNGLASAWRRAGTEVCSPPAQVALEQRAPGEDGWAILWQGLTHIHELPS